VEVAWEDDPGGLMNMKNRFKFQLALKKSWINDHAQLGFDVRRTNLVRLALLKV
jgi:hypothetical protein